MPRVIVLATGGKKAVASNISTFCFYDKKAKKEFYSNSPISPWSPYTGLASVRKNQTKMVLSSEKIAENLHKLAECPTCHASISINKTAAKEKPLQKHLFCPVCATDLHDDLPSTEDAMTLVPESEDTAVNDTEFPEVNVDSEEPEEFTDALEDVSTRRGPDEDSDPELLETQRRSFVPTMASKKDRKDRKAKRAEKQAKRDRKAAKNPSRKDATITQRKPPATIDKPVLPHDAAYEAVTGEPVTASVKKDLLTINFASTNLNKADLSIVPVSAGKTYLFANQNPVMVLRVAKASNAIKPLFTQPAKLLEALSNTIAAGEFVPKDFGAKPIRVKVAISNSLAQKHKLLSEKLAASYKEKEAKLEKSFFNALCVAAVAVNKNTVEKHPNTLKTTLVAMMRDNGVRNPEKIVDHAFSTASESFLRNVLGYAKDFRSKSRTAQKEIQKFIASASYNTVAADDNSDDIAEHLSHSNAGLETFASFSNNEPLETFATETPVDGSVTYYAQLLRK